jgi:hypothetical protein
VETFISRDQYAPGLVPLSLYSIEQKEQVYLLALGADVYTRRDNRLLVGSSMATYDSHLSGFGSPVRSLAKKVCAINEGLERRDGGRRNEKKP